MQNVVVDGFQAESRSARRQSRPDRSEKKRECLKQQLELFSVIMLAAICLVCFAWPLFSSASENVRLVGTFNTDEEAHVILVKQAIDDRSPRLGYIQYGYAYLNMGLLPLLMLSYFTEVSEQHIIVWLRMIPTLFAIATIALTFLVSRDYFGHLAAWLSAFLLTFTVPNFLEMSAMSHADIPQLFFLMLSVYFCCRLAGDGHLKWLIWSSVAAGFAFGCKYSGLFLLPIIGLYGTLATITLDTTRFRVNSDRVVKVSRLLVACAGAGLLILGFVVVPYAAAPYADAEYFGVSISQFLDSLRIMSIVAGAGLVLLAVVPFTWAFVRQRPKLTYLLKLGLLAAIAFAMAFFATSPFNVFSVRSGFMRGFLYESLHSGFGHGFQAQDDRLEWFSILLSSELLDPFILGLAIVSLTLTLYKVAKRGWQWLLEPESVMWAWTIFYSVFLVWRVNIRTHRALLPIVPFLIVFAAHAVSQMIRYAATRLSKRLVAVLTTVSLLIVAGYELPKSLDRLLEFRRVTSQREQTSDAVLAGNWLAEHYTPSTRILYDPFTYIPPLFADAHATPWGGTLQILETLEPDVVIVNDYNSRRFSDVRQAEAYVRGEDQFVAKFKYYKMLIDGEAGYVLVRDFGDVQVYARRR
jgi:hypothetical protein